MKNINYYEDLGVSPTATQAQINKAYRKLAFLNHPDRNKSPGSEEKTKSINIAHDNLSDPIKRRIHDALLREQNAQQQAEKQASHTSGQPRPSSNSAPRYTAPKPKSSYSSTRQTNTPPKSATVKPKSKHGGLIFWAILGIIFLVQILSKTNTDSNTISPTTLTQPQLVVPVETPSSVPTYNYTQPTYTPTPDLTASTPLPTSVPTIDCIGPDGKHLMVSQQECDSFNSAWKPTPQPTVQPSANYFQDNNSNNCSQCGANSHCSYGSCVCDNGYSKNYSSGACDKVNCPANSTISGGNCNCNDGYSMNYSTGLCDPCPPNSTGTYGTCTCNSGYQKNYSTGLCDLCPANSSGTYGSCTCNDGYAKNYSTGQCDKLNCPSNSSAQYGNCVCNNGYVKNYSTGQCDTCPANSTWSYGNCVCNSGFTKNYSTGQCDVTH